jgi:hypothetical protein
MNKSTKIFLGGVVIAVLVVLGGLANTYRLDSKVKELESMCVKEGKNDKS